MLILLLEAPEHVALEGVLADVLDPTLDLAFVSRPVGLGGQNDRAIVLAEGLDLGVEVGIEPVGFVHGRPQVVDHDRLGYSAEGPKRVLHDPNELVGGLTPHPLTVAFARVAQHDAKHV